MATSKSAIVVTIAAVIMMTAAVSVVAIANHDNDEDKYVTVTINNDGHGLKMVAAQSICSSLNSTLNPVLVSLNITWECVKVGSGNTMYVVTKNMPKGTIITQGIIDAIDGCVAASTPYTIDLTQSGITPGVTTFDQVNTIVVSGS